MRISFCLFFILLMSPALFAQEVKPEEKLVLSDSLVFMGIDFGLAKMVSPSLKDKSDEIKNNNGPAWAGIDDIWCKNNNLKFDFSKKKVICMPQIFDKSYERWDSAWVVDSAKALSDDRIAAEVKTYAPLPGYRLGFAFIVERMDAKKGLLTMYGVYIDLADHSVLKSIRCTGGEDGFGLTKSWAGAVDNAYTAFVNTNFNYLNHLRSHFKKEKQKEKPAK